MLMLSSSTPDIAPKIVSYSQKYNVSPATVAAVIQCESGGNKDAVGDQGDARGLVQISRKYHGDISDTQAFDPDFSLDYLAQKLSTHEGYLWTCWRNLRVK